MAETTDSDIRLMRVALEEAETAGRAGEVPVGAVVEQDGEIIGRGHNQRETSGDPTAHAELIALRDAAKAGWRLNGVTVAATLEPCPMCAGALVNARVGRLIYGAADPKAGAALSLYNIVQDPRLNHQMELSWGVLEEECAQLLSAFFANLRENGAGE